MRLQHFTSGWHECWRVLYKPRFQFSSSWDFLFRGRAPFRFRSWRLNAGAELNEARFSISHFPSRRTSDWAVSCAEAILRRYPFANAIRSSVTDAAASRRTMSITTGLASVAVPVLVAGRPSPSRRGFHSLTRATARWLVVRHYGGVLWSTAAGKRRGPRSKTLIGARPLHAPSLGLRPSDVGGVPIGN